MKLRRVMVFLLCILLAVSLKFPEAYQLLGIDPGVISFKLPLPINALAADALVQSTEEFEAEILAAVRAVKDDVSIRVAVYDEKSFDINAAFKKVLSENAGVGFVTGCNSTVTRAFGRKGADILLEFQYSYPKEKILAMRLEADSRVNEIIEKIIRPEMDAYERVLAVHDYLIKNSRYDRLNADNGTVPVEGHESYGVLVEGIGVCDSYAKAVKLLLDKAGVECLLVEGNKEGTEQGSGDVDHAWNIVRIDGEYYHLDATWDDSGKERNSDELLYHFLNLNDEEMQKTHIWDRSKYPDCNGTKYNYFRYSNLMAGDKTELLSMLTKAISGREKRLMVKVSDYSSRAYNIEELIRKAAEKSRLRQGISAMWIVNDSLGIVDIELLY